MHGRDMGDKGEADDDNKPKQAVAAARAKTQLRSQRPKLDYKIGWAHEVSTVESRCLRCDRSRILNLNLMSQSMWNILLTRKMYLHILILKQKTL